MKRIIVLSLALAVIALILILASIPIVLLWDWIKKEGSRET